MFRHDPVAPMVRAKMAEWLQKAEQARLRRSARQSCTPSEQSGASSAGLSGWLGRLMHHLRGLASAAIEPSDRVGSVTARYTER